jgi:hypothetical protein
MPLPFWLFSFYFSASVIDPSIMLMITLKWLFLNNFNLIKHAWTAWSYYEMFHFHKRSIKNYMYHLCLQCLKWGPAKGWSEKNNFGTVKYLCQWPKLHNGGPKMLTFYSAIKVGIFFLYQHQHHKWQTLSIYIVYCCWNLCCILPFLNDPWVKRSVVHKNAKLCL